METSNVSSAQQVKTNSNSNAKRATQIRVKKNETIATLAKRFGLSKDEFIKWTGVSSVKSGDVINLSTDKVEEHKGLYSLAKKYNMTLAELAKLNGIEPPYDNYTVGRDEVFYVRKDKLKSSSTPAPASTAATAPKPQPAQVKPQAKPQEPVKPEDANKQKWGSKYTPEELAAKIYEGSGKYWGAVGKKDFDNLLAEINPKNITAVLDAYTKNPKNTKKETLINTIAGEITSSSQKRKDAVMRIYDTLATAKKLPAATRTEFKTELDKQFGNWGVVNTKTLDQIIDKSLKYETKSATSDSSTKVTNDKTNVYLTKSKKTMSVSDLHRGAISSGVKDAKAAFREYCKANNIKYDEKLLNLAPINRYPAPTVKNGKIVMEQSELLKPTTAPNGKVIILNAGHGGYSSRTGYFDPGAYSFIKKADGTYAPLLEYEKARSYANSMADKLRAKGYTVVITSGHSETMNDEGSMRNLVTSLNNGSKGNIKYKKDNILMLSLHADSSPGQKGSAVCYRPGTDNDETLAKSLNNALNNEKADSRWIISDLQQRVERKNGVGILNSTKDIPSALVEIEYVNGGRCKNLDSPAYQARFETQLLEGIDNYYKTK